MVNPLSVGLKSEGFNCGQGPLGWTLVAQQIAADIITEREVLLTQSYSLDRPKQLKKLI